MKTSTSCIERVLAAIESASGYSFDLNFVLKLAGRVDETVLAQALRQCLTVEPAFACQFKEGWWQPYWSLPHTDAMEYAIEVRDVPDHDSALQEALCAEADSRDGSGLRVILLRGVCDTLCLKLDHKLGDGQTLRLFGALLAENYSRRLTNPEAMAPAGSLRNRLVAQVMQDLPAEEKGKILRLAVANKGRFDRSSQWKIPRPETKTDGLSRKRFQVRRMSSRQSEALTAYARQEGVSVNTVLMSVVMRAAIAAFQRGDSRRCEVIQTVDLRRHLHNREMPLFGNFSSMIPVSIEAGGAETLANVVNQVNLELRAARSEYLGLTHPLVRWEINPRRRFLFQCIPFRMLKRVTRRRLDALERADSPGRLVLSNVGTIDPDALTFGEVAVDEAFFTAGVLTHRQMILLAATQFRGCWTLACGYSPRHMEESAMVRFLEGIVAHVPEPSGPL